MRTRGVRIVYSGNRSPADPAAFDVLDLETGEKLVDIYQIELDISRASATIRITSSAPWVYEGPAEFITPEESGND